MDNNIKKIFDEFSIMASILIEDRENLLEKIEYVKTLDDESKVEYVKENSQELINRDLSQTKDDIILKVIKKYIDLNILIKKETELIKNCYNVINSNNNEIEILKDFEIEYLKYFTFMSSTYPLLRDGILNRKN